MYKNSISVMLLISICLSMLCGCSAKQIQPNQVTGDEYSGSLSSVDHETEHGFVDSEKEYQVLVCGYSDSISSVDHEIEYVFEDSEKYADIIPEQKLTMVVNEQNYIGDYLRTSYIGSNYFPTYEYSSKENRVSFSVDEKGFLVNYIKHSSCNNENVCSEQECLQIAKDFLNKFADVSQYTTKIEINEESKYYTIRFEKYVGDFKTADKATIDVFFDGEVYCYSSFMLGRIPVETKTSDIDMDGIHSAVKERLDVMYQHAKEVYDRVEYGEPKFELTILKDGRRGICYWIDVDCIDIVGEYTTSTGELLYMVIPLDLQKAE